jgi:tetratricopeptide (TPR) repeat protein
VVLLLAMTCAALASADPVQPANTARVVAVAQDFVRMGQLAQAAELLEVYLAATPDDTIARLEYARVQAFRRHDQQAMVEYRKVLAAEPYNPAALVGVAKITSWQGDFNGALETYERVLERNPRYYDALAGKAFTLRWLARIEDAKAAFATLARYHRVDNEVAAAMRELGVPAQRTEASVPAPASGPRRVLPAAGKMPRAGAYEVTKRESVPVVEVTGGEPGAPPQRRHVLWAASGVVMAIVGLGMAWTRRARRYLHAPQPMPVFAAPPPVIEVKMPREEGQVRRVSLEEPIEGARLLLIGSDGLLLNQMADALNLSGAHVAVAQEHSQAERLLEMGEFDAVVVQRGSGDEEIYERMKQRGEERCMMLIVCGGEAPPMRVLKLHHPFRREELLSMARLLVRRAIRPN